MATPYQLHGDPPRSPRKAPPPTGLFAGVCSTKKGHAPLLFFRLDVGTYKTIGESAGRDLTGAYGKACKNASGIIAYRV